MGRAFASHSSLIFTLEDNTSPSILPSSSPLSFTQLQSEHSSTMLHHEKNTAATAQDNSSTEKVDYEKAVSLHENTSDEVFDNKSTKRLLRKMDTHLLPFLALLYLLSFLDRANIGNAKLAGLEESLNLTGKWDYNIAVSVFFPFYVAAEIPSNLAMKRFRPSIWIPFIMIIWSAMTCVMGAVHNFGGLLATRMAIFFSAATAAGAFGGLLARGIMEMDGVGGLDGWAWIFIIEGIVTFFFAVMAFFVMYDYPDTAKFLDDTERKEVIRRLEEDRSVLSDEFKWQFFRDALKDWKIWVHMVITIGIYTPLCSISIFLPTIVKGLGYTNEMAQLMTVPPYVVACLFTIAGGYAADKYGQRGIYMIFFCCVAIVGFVILAAVESNGAKYFGAFMITCGIYPNVPQGVAWNGNNIGGSLKRGVGI